jgi:ABC-2 type transport system ATP-binding protein
MSQSAEIDLSHPAIAVENLQRCFGCLKAVDDVSFRIDHGRVVGFVGANGAGKTTIMRIMATLDQPDAGQVKIGGHNVVHYPDKVRRLLGWMPDSFGTYEHMTVLEYLDFYARALGYQGAERVQRIQEVMDFTDLTPLADRLSNKMSKGQTQRLCLGRALLHDPQILIMDEPAAGLDPKARVELKQLIRILAEEGKTILISSHILSELGEVCDSLLFIDKGRIVHHGDADSMTRSSLNSEETILNVQIIGGSSKLIEWALTAPMVEVIEETKRGARLRLKSTDENIIAGTLKRLVIDGIQLTDFHREERRLEDAFIDLLGQIDKGTHKPAEVIPPPLPPLR